MAAELLTIGHTRAVRGQKLRARVLGIPGLLVATLLIAGFGYSALQQATLSVRAFLPFAIVFVLYALHRFIQDILQNPSLPPRAEEGLAGMLSVDMLQELSRYSAIDAAHLLGAALSSKRGAFFLHEMGMEKDAVLARSNEEVRTSVDVVSFMQDLASKRASQEGRISAPDILKTLLLFTASGKKVLEEADLSEDDLEGIVRWEAFHHSFRLKEHPFSSAALARNASLGRSWVMGYTNALDLLTTEYPTELPSAGEASVVIRTDTVDQVVTMLSRGRQKNVLIMGRHGTGKRTLIQHAAIALRQHEREKNLPFTRVVELHLEQLLSGTAQNDAFFLDALQKAQQAGNFVIVIKNVAPLLQSQNENLKTVFIKALESKKLNVVAMIDTQDYHRLIKTNSALSSQFETIALEDAEDEDCMKVLMAHYFALEQKNLHVTYKALQAVLRLSKRYLGARGGLPGVAVEVLDETMLRAAESGKATITPTDIRDIVSVKGKVNVSALTDTEKDRLRSLETSLGTHVIGQKSALKAIASSLKRARLEITERKRPVGTFLFLGPTGVGKTETAKALAAEYFGSAESMIRIDMNEYSHSDSVFNIIGTSDGKEGFLTQRVQEKPFSLILLDEIEKAHPSVLNIFLQILDEGFLTDGKGLKTDFRNTIIIATSNAGALFIRDFVKENQEFNKAEFKKQLLDEIIKQKLYSPEFLNRFDDIILYYPLSKEDAKQVAQLMIGSIVADIERSKGIRVTVTPELLDALVEHGYSVEFGAREMRRTITDKIEDYLANYFLEHPVKRGDAIAISAEDIQW